MSKPNTPNRSRGDGARVLMVSKPVAPPWNDSSKNLVRDLAGSLSRHQATVMTHDGAQLGFSPTRVAAVYPTGGGRFAPALSSNARVLWHLLTGPRHDIWHFFFAPNARSSTASAWAARARQMRTVQTVCSAPSDGPAFAQWLFADRVVVLSRSTEARVLGAGVSPARVRRIAPAVTPIELPSEAQLRAFRDAHALPQDRSLLVYPGDLEFSGGAECVIRAHARLQSNAQSTLVLACRAKTQRAREHEARLRALVASLGLQASTHWLGETAQIHTLLAAADVVALPADTLYAKMDLPLVLIEAMWLARPVITSRTTAAAELADDDAALALTPEPDVLADAIARLFTQPERRLQMGERARRAAVERYHPVRMASAYETVYDELYR